MENEGEDHVMAACGDFYAPRFDALYDKYLPDWGEGDNMASQTVTAVNKLIYKWYNDGDVYDNTHHMQGWLNNLSSYANWLYKHTTAAEVLSGIEKCEDDDDYESLLYSLACELIDPDYLDGLATKQAVGSIYKCDGPFKFVSRDY